MKLTELCVAVEMRNKDEFEKKLREVIGLSIKLEQAMIELNQMKIEVHAEVIKV